MDTHIHLNLSGALLLLLLPRISRLSSASRYEAEEQSQIHLRTSREFFLVFFVCVIVVFCLFLPSLQHTIPINFSQMSYQTKTEPDNANLRCKKKKKKKKNFPLQPPPVCALADALLHQRPRSASDVGVARRGPPSPRADLFNT